MLFSKCKEFGLRGLPAPPASWPDEAQLLLLETVERAVPRFITNSLPKWRPDGGASIETYFINYCLYEFKKIYKSFCRREYAVQQHEVLYDNVSSIFDARHGPGPENLAIARYAITEAAKLIDSDLDREIISRTAQEMPQKQIARDLGVSVNTIVRRLKAYRRKLGDNGWTTGNVVNDEQ
jgi:DNA-binding CsgD family transcriptional regulator